LSAQIEVRSPPRFPSYISLEYEEFNSEWFDEIMTLTKTRHRAYHLNGDSTLQILIGITHPIEFKIKAKPETIKKIIQDLRVKYGFKKAKWTWR